MQRVDAGAQRRESRLERVAAVAAILISSSVLVAQTFPVPIPKCWREGCINTTSVQTCRTCCLSECPNSDPVGCQDWCRIRIFP